MSVWVKILDGNNRPCLISVSAINMSPSEKKLQLRTDTSRLHKTKRFANDEEMEQRFNEIVGFINNGTVVLDLMNLFEAE